MSSLINKKNLGLSAAPSIHLVAMLNVAMATVPILSFFTAIACINRWKFEYQDMTSPPPSMMGVIKRTLSYIRTISLNFPCSLLQGPVGRCNPPDIRTRSAMLLEMSVGAL